MLLSIVVPVYKEERNVPEFLRRVQPIVGALTADYEIIFALDPSPDRTEEVILQERERDPRVKLLRYSRRFGQPMATMGGLSYSGGEAVIVMDVDLQDPPELIATLVEKWREGYEVVLPQRRARTGEPWIKRLVAATGYKVINRISEVNIPPNTGDFRLMSRRVVNEVVRLKESHGFLRGMVAVVGFRQCLVPFDRPARFAGQTNYNRFFGSLRIGFNGIFGFSSYALTLSTQLGFFIATVSFMGAIIYLVMKLRGHPFPLGNPTTVILILFLGGIQLISIGILGEYIGRIYEEVRSRPKFIVDRAEGFGERRLRTGARMLDYEDRNQPLLPRRRFYRRVARTGTAGVLLLGIALGGGMVGYKVTEHMSWIDAFANASMILSGMGPVTNLQTSAGKLFAGCYALFSGLAFISIAALVLAPFAHRLFHKFHLADGS